MFIFFSRKHKLYPSVPLTTETHLLPLDFELEGILNVIVINSLSFSFMKQLQNARHWAKSRGYKNTCCQGAYILLEGTTCCCTRQMPGDWAGARLQVEGTWVGSWRKRGILRESISRHGDGHCCGIWEPIRKPVWLSPGVHGGEERVESWRSRLRPAFTAGNRHIKASDSSCWWRSHTLWGGGIHSIEKEVWYSGNTTGIGFRESVFKSRIRHHLYDLRQATPCPWKWSLSFLICNMKKLDQLVSKVPVQFQNDGSMRL